MPKTKSPLKSRKMLVVGNWKMNPQSAKLAQNIVRTVLNNKPKTSGSSVVFCPPFVYLDALRKVSPKLVLGVQNIFGEVDGAYTGEISGAMAYDRGARYAILGHSERREQGETNSLINRKLKIALKEGLVPILCIGEKDRDPHHGYFKVIRQELEECLSGISKSSIENLVIAYEPVWAIGENALREATPEEFREVSVYIRKFISDKFSTSVASSLKILYGGSVNPKNCRGFKEEGEADGFLVGRDSLNPKKFLEIIKISGE